MSSAPTAALAWLLDGENGPCIARLNEILADLAHLVPVTPLPAPDPVFIVGLPRSGTTLCYQLMAGCLDIGYVNNLMARFWLAPVLGAYLSREVYRVDATVDLASDLGRTRDLGGVHEFGYFWQRFFDATVSDYAAACRPGMEPVLRAEVGGLMAVFGKPFVFKNLTCGQRIGALARCFPKARFIVVERRLTETALSILAARRRFLPSEDQWWSLRPRDVMALEGLPVAEQIAGQILSGRRELWGQLRRCGAEHLTLVYEEVCRDPAAALEAVATFIGAEPTDEAIPVLAPTSHLPAEDAVAIALVEMMGAQA